jgi:hypothetical protein
VTTKKNDRGKKKKKKTKKKKTKKKKLEEYEDANDPSFASPGAAAATIVPHISGCTMARTSFIRPNSTTTRSRDTTTTSTSFAAAAFPTMNIVSPQQPQQTQQPQQQHSFHSRKRRSIIMDEEEELATRIDDDDDDDSYVTLTTKKSSQYKKKKMKLRRTDDEERIDEKEDDDNKKPPCLLFDTIETKDDQVRCGPQYHTTIVQCNIDPNRNINMKNNVSDQFRLYTNVSFDKFLFVGCNETLGRLYFTGFYHEKNKVPLYMRDIIQMTEDTPPKYAMIVCCFLATKSFYQKIIAKENCHPNKKRYKKNWVQVKGKKRNKI